MEPLTSEPHPTEVERRDRRPAWIATVIALIPLVVYVTLITGEGDNDWYDVAPWAALMVVTVVITAAGAVVQPAKHARAALLLASVLLFALGLVSLLTIGTLFLVAGAAALVAAIRVS